MRISRWSVVGGGVGLVAAACAVGTSPSDDETNDAGLKDAAGDVAADTHSDGPVVNDAGSADVSEAGPDAAEDAPVDAGDTVHIVFVSSELYDGNLGGLAGADAKCQALATDAGLLGTYMAWLSDTASPAANRLAHSAVPYVLVDRQTVVAQDFFSLGETLLHAIDQTETGQPPPVGTYQLLLEGGTTPTVWTGTDSSGLQQGGNCNDWKSNSSPYGSAGAASANFITHGGWTQYCSCVNHGCGDTAALYCFQQ
jgi:hypothetical protein